MTEKPPYEELEKKIQEQELRKQAEKILQERLIDNRDPSELTPEQIHSLLHELQVHQIELEMQNDELRRSQEELIKSKIIYIELYDLAPVGYFTINSKGLILKANLTLTGMLSIERRFLIGQSFSAHILFEDQDIFYFYLQNLSTLKKRQICELRLKKKDGKPLYVQLESNIILSECEEPDQYHIIVIDITERMQAEDALKYSKLQFEAVLNNLDSSIYITDMESNEILFMNQQMKDEFGKDFTGKICWRFIHNNQDGPCEFCTNDKLVDDNGKLTGPYIWEIYNQKLNRWYELHDQAIPWTNGKLVRMEIAFDITERKQMAKVLQESEGKNKALQEATFEALFFSDKGVCIEANNSASKLFGYKPDAFIGIFGTDVIADESKAIVKDKMLSGYDQPYEAIAQRKDGSKFWAEFHGKMFDYQEKMIRVTSARDITERKQAEVALEKAKKQWETTFDAMSDWVCIINRDHEIIQSNKACESIINLSVDQVVGRRCHEIVHGMDFHILDCPLQKAIKSNRLESMEFKTGDNRWMQITVDPIKIGTNNDRFVHIVRDITEAKERENESIMVQKAKAFSILSGGIAHDYNNLLTIIWGNICLLKEEMTHPSQQELLNDVDKACRQARDLTHQFITLSHAAMLKKASYNIEDILSSAIEKASEAKDIEISIDIKDEIPAMELDPDGLALAFENIICNAVEAMPDGGRLEILVKTETVKGQQDESVIKIFFKDSGIGISIHDIDSVFDPYFTTKELGIQKGGGLGLAVSQSIVRKHGRNVRINSKL
ncbi:MAG: PAS domain S-box protein [Desulfobacula sp.]|uniref:PAS domain-containing sensor histidine kinase n=1 Tax=Desulfobacula sp. TaxID=2593537 RepID=UPI001EBB9869|nr:PAS domain S-box protein [Desulfobacula sp.]